MRVREASCSATSLRSVVGARGPQLKPEAFLVALEAELSQMPESLGYSEFSYFQMYVESAKQDIFLRGRAAITGAE